VEGDPEFPGLEWLAEWLGFERSTIADHLAPGAFVWIEDPTGHRRKADAIRENVRQFHDRTKRSYAPLPEPTGIEPTLEKIAARLAGVSRVRQEYFASPGAFDFKTSQPPVFMAHVGRLAEFLQAQEERACRTWILCDAEPHETRLREILEAEGGIPHGTSLSTPGVHGGFCFADGDTALVDHEVFNRHYKQYRRRRFR
jgi:hypothetical protein